MAWFRARPRHDVVVYSRADCLLCEEALEVLRRHRNLNVRLVDIAGDEALTARHGERIPVVEIDGKERFFGRIDPVLLRRIIDREPDRPI